MLVAFDLDGTLIDARDIHYRCFNDALALAGCPPIDYDYHLRRLDGLPTSQKMKMLVANGSLDPRACQAVEAEKRRLTMQRIVPNGPEPRITAVFEALKSAGHKTAIVSNARWETVNSVIEALQISPDVVISNEDVRLPKPFPEGYLRAMVETGASPAETIVLEDAPRGKEAARRSGARLVPVFDHDDLTADEVMRYVGGGTSFDVVIPMAGEGKRFRDAGHLVPKPLISVRGVPMVGVATSTLGMPEARHIYLVSSSHLREWPTEQILRGLTENVEIVPVDDLTEGAACTVMLAKELIDHDRPVIVANCDQWIGWHDSADDALHRMISKRAVASVLTFPSDGDPKWSYARVDGDGIVTETAEKRVISDRAICGVFMYRRGRDLVGSVERMIGLDDRTNGEFYVAPSLNYLPGMITHEPALMRGLGTPADLDAFLADPP